MPIILTILKIIGIIILCVLAAAMLVMFLVLFWPIRYRAAGKYDAGGAYLEGKVRWFLGLVSIDARYENGQPLAAKARILFVTIFDLQKRGGNGGMLRRRKRKKELRKEPELSAASADAGDDAGEEDAVKADAKAIDVEETDVEETDAKKADVKEADVKEADVKGADVKEADVKGADVKDADVQEADARKSGESAAVAEEKGFFKKVRKFFAKLVRFIDNIKFTFEKICDTIVKVRDNARHYWELWQEESAKQAFELCKRQLLKIWRHSSPRKYEMRLHLGFEDPSVMGNVLALWGMLYPFHLGRIDIIPEFDRKIIEGSFKFTGRVNVYVFLWAAWLFMTDKNIKRLRRKFFI